MDERGASGPGISEHALRTLRRAGVGAWTDDDGLALRASIGRVVRRRERVRAVARVGVPAAGALALVLVLRSGALPSRPVAVAPAMPPAPTSQARFIVLEDGTSIEPVDADSVVDASGARHAGAPEVTLGRGGARFRVSPQAAGRSFRVTAGAVVVEVVGTVFSVDRRGDAVDVVVDEGRAKVVYPGGQRTLASGQRGSFPASATEVTQLPAEEAPAAAPSPLPARRAAAGWRSLAHAGRYDAAFKALERTPDPVRDEPGDLMLAADVARLSHHPEQAVKPLRRVFEQYPSDDRASPAAFLLGRLYLENLGQAATAAESFARARSLAPKGALAEDALAREIEARVRAEDHARAESLAAEYVRRFPRGARRAALEDLVRGRAVDKTVATTPAAR
jgi:transmembrane sensor